MKMETKQCLECGEKIIGRIDKKFCTDYCRNSYNNKVNKESKNLIRNTNNRLRKNYNILSKLNVSGKTKVTRRKLFDKGFDFNFFTSIYTTKTGNVYYYVYDEGYLPLENETTIWISQAVFKEFQEFLILDTLLFLYFICLSNHCFLDGYRQVLVLVSNSDLC